MSIPAERLPNEFENNIVQIHYCKAGQIAWETENGNRIYLNPGDFSIHERNATFRPTMTFPTEYYEGLLLYVDPQKLSMPAWLTDTDLLNGEFFKRYCENRRIASFSGNGETEAIFAGFFDQPEQVKLPYGKLKTLELFLYLSKAELTTRNRLTEYRSEQVAVVREVHDQLTQHMGHRITIKELSRQYHMNPTTLKAAFKSVYGSSIAAHMKEHRMMHAAQMLRTSELSIAEIAQAVGYDSQSKFAAAFKAYFHVLPKEYRKNNHTGEIPVCDI